MLQLGRRTRRSGDLRISGIVPRSSGHPHGQMLQNVTGIIRQIDDPSWRLLWNDSVPGRELCEIEQFPPEHGNVRQREGRLLCPGRIRTRLPWPTHIEIGSRCFGIDDICGRSRSCLLSGKTWRRTFYSVCRNFARVCSLGNSACVCMFASLSLRSAGFI